jgi:DNA-binding response OmpR family regulator
MTQDPSYHSSVRLLIVDDSPSALRMLQAVFEHEQYDVLTASDGQEAYAKANQFRPDLVITDSVMPIMGGFALLKKLREGAVTRNLPVIILSAEDPIHAKAASGGLTPDAFVMKSDDLQPLIDAVVRVLAERAEEAKQTTPAGDAGKKS